MFIANCTLKFRLQLRRSTIPLVHKSVCIHFHRKVQDIAVLHLNLHFRQEEQTTIVFRFYGSLLPFSALFQIQLSAVFLTLDRFSQFLLKDR